MKVSRLRTLFTAAIFISLLAVPAFSQDDMSADIKESPMPASDSDVMSQSKEIAIYGEAQTINVLTNSISVQYYDYDSDSEKIIEVIVKTDTKLENAVSLSEIKKGDWVDVTYVIDNGKDIAKIITVEKEEVLGLEETSAQMNAPTSNTAE